MKRMKYSEWRAGEIKRFRGSIEDRENIGQKAVLFAEQLSILAGFVRQCVERKRPSDIRKLCQMVEPEANYRSRWLFLYFSDADQDALSPKQTTNVIRSFFGSTVIDGARLTPFSNGGEVERYFSHNAWKRGLKVSPSQFGRLKNTLVRKIVQYDEGGSVTRITLKESLESAPPVKKFLTNNLHKWDRAQWESLSAADRDAYWQKLVNGRTSWIEAANGSQRTVSRPVWELLSAPDTTEDLISVGGKR